MSISTSKTETMSVGSTKVTLNISVGRKPITQCKEFKYLGSIFAEDDRMDRTIEARTQSANAVLHQIHCSNMLTSQ
jgi:hypothetical protein